MIIIPAALCRQIKNNTISMPFQIENLVSYAWLVFNRFYHAP